MDVGISHVSHEEKLVDQVIGNIDIITVGGTQKPVHGIVVKLAEAGVCDPILPDQAR